MKADLVQIEATILRGLLDFTPRNQNQMTDIIGSHNKSTDRVHVTRSLKHLKPFLTQRLPGYDESGKIWILKQDIETIRLIAIKYPSLISDLQNNDKIISLLVDIHKFIYDTMVIGHLVVKVDNMEHLNQDKEDLKEKLMLSPTFFKTCLMNKPEKLREMFIKLGTLSDRGMANELLKEALKRINGVREPDNFITLTINDIFISCVHNDVLNGDENTEAFNHVAEIMFKDGSNTVETMEELKKTEKEIELLIKN